MGVVGAKFLLDEKKAVSTSCPGAEALERCCGWCMTGTRRCVLLDSGSRREESGQKGGW